MRYFMIVCCLLLLTACSEVEQATEAGRQVIETGKQAVETGKQVIETGKQLAESEIAQQLKAYLQEKYDASENLRKAMFSGDGELLVNELKNTELTQFTFYESQLLDVKFIGKLTADGTFQVLRQPLSKPDESPTVVKEFHAFLNNSGQIEVQ